MNKTDAISKGIGLLNGTIAGTKDQKERLKDHIQVDGLVANLEDALQGLRYGEEADAIAVASQRVRKAQKTYYSFKDSNKDIKQKLLIESKQAEADLDKLLKQYFSNE